MNSRHIAATVLPNGVHRRQPARREPSRCRTTLIVDVRGLYERRLENGDLTPTYRVPVDGRMVAQIVRTPALAKPWIDTIESLHDDHLGSTHVVTDETGGVVRTVAYDPRRSSTSCEGRPAMQPVGGEADR